MADRVPFGTGQAGPALRRAIGIGSVAHGEDLDEELFLVEAVDDAVVAPSGRTAAAPWLGQLLAQAVRVQASGPVISSTTALATRGGRRSRSRSARRETTSRQVGGSPDATYSPRPGAGWRA